MDGQDARVICNHVTTVAVSRLVPPHRGMVPKMGKGDFQEFTLWAMAESAACQNTLDGLKQPLHDHPLLAGR